MPFALQKAERKVPYSVTFSPTYHYPSEAVAVPGGKVVLANGTQYKESERHPYNRKQRKYESGGPFFTSLVEYGGDTVDVEDCFSGDRTYTGPVCLKPPTSADFNDVSFPEPKYHSRNESGMDALGATAISRCGPSNPSSNLGQALLETRRDGLPSLHGAHTWKDRAHLARSAGSEYLNHQFGWAPLVRDVQDGARVAGNSGALAERYASKEANDVRRGYDFPSEEETQTHVKKVQSRCTFSGMDNKFIWATTSLPVLTVSRVSVTKRWFRGAFTYALPSKDDFWRRHIESGVKARELYGLELTPELLWEVAPWSWAVDWFSNIGDVISNVSRFASAGQTLRYGYMMEESIDKLTITQDYTGLRANPATGDPERNRFLGPLSSYVLIRTKRRREANPFGFGIGWEGLSPFQLSIAAALGLSRLR